MSPRRQTLSLLLVAALAASPLAATASDLAWRLTARAPERLALVARGAALAEELAGAPALLATLERAAPGDEIVLPDWPVAPGDRRPVRLVRHEVYAPGARVVAVAGGREIELPRSARRFFWGESEDGEARVLLELDPAPAVLRALSFLAGEGFEMHAEPGGGYRLAAERDLLPAGAQSHDWDCGQAALGAAAFAPSAADWSAAEMLAADEKAITTLHTATIAVDTDNEILINKFGNNTTTATNYIASLFAAMNVMYERDLLVRLLVGTTFLRISTDPYSQTNQVQKLYEFTNYWAAGCGGVGQPSCVGIARALALLLSGRGTSGAAGIAWIDVLCSASHGYAYSQVYLSGTSVSWGDTLVTGHELGHNFGSPHTHCYSPPIDTCYRAEPSCYSGGTSCPAPTTINGVTNVRGTLMSYCHNLGGCASSLVYHPTSVALLAPKIQARVGTCIFPAASPTIYSDGFEGTSTPAGGWSRRRP